MKPFQTTDIVYSYRFKAFGVVGGLFPSAAWPARTIAQWATIKLIDHRLHTANLPVDDLRHATEREKAVLTAKQALGLDP